MSKDIIYREDAIEAIHGYWKGELNKMPTVNSEYGEVIDGDYNTLLKHNKELSIRIKDIPSADRPQGWIPCSERLPREYEVLCCDIYKNCIVGHPFAEDSASTGFCAESEGVFLYECIAWMPLPKPWEGADDEN